MSIQIISAGFLNRHCGEIVEKRWKTMGYSIASAAMTVQGEAS
jgi:hypothetical protein